METNTKFHSDDEDNTIKKKSPNLILPKKKPVPSPRSIGVIAATRDFRSDEHRGNINENASSHGSNTDSELESIGEVSSDGGEYQDLPIIIEGADAPGVTNEHQAILTDRSDNNKGSKMDLRGYQERQVQEFNTTPQ